MKTELARFERVVPLVACLLLAACGGGNKGGGSNGGGHQGGDVLALMRARDLSEQDVTAALKTYMPTGRFDEYYTFASGGHGGNVIVVRHDGVPGVFATRYDHLKKDSVLVEPGDAVTRGQKIAEAASARSAAGRTAS